MVISQRMVNQRKLLQEEQEKQIEVMVKRYQDKDSRTDMIIKRKEYETKVFSELDMIKKRKRLEEVKRLERITSYQNAKEFETLQDERSKSSFVQEQRQMVLNYRNEESKKIHAIKDKLKKKIMSAKGIFHYFNLQDMDLLNSIG
jgi:hypothetical protein